MIHNSATFRLTGWFGVAGGISVPQDWSKWASGQLEIFPKLPRPNLENIPGRVSRRLDVLGRCVMFVFEQCVPLIDSEPAIISVSRHGDLPSMDKLIQCSRERSDISPTAFTYSVHNRFSSLISMFAGYHGVNGAYSSVRDGFPLALSEAAALITESPSLRVFVVAYESEIPEAYHQVISSQWSPHVAGFVLQKADEAAVNYSLFRHSSETLSTPDRGSCLPFIRTIVNKSNNRDGYWEYQFVE
jgi:hypothetical protein